jgi:hypothetical protein
MWQWTSITVCLSVVERQPSIEWRRGSHDANVRARSDGRQSVPRAPDGRHAGLTVRVANSGLEGTSSFLVGAVAGDDEARIHLADGTGSFHDAIEQLLPT